MTLWPLSHVRSCDKIKTKYFILDNACGHHLGRMWLIMKMTHHNVTWPSDHVVTWGYVTKWKQNTSSSVKPMATKPGRVVTYDKRNSPVMSDDPMITWSREVTWLIQSLISPFPQGLWPPNMTYGLIWPSGKVVMCGKVTN